MMKKIVYAGIAIAITIGAAYSYERVRFGERTVVFFKRALGGESDQRFARGRGGENSVTIPPALSSTGMEQEETDRHDPNLSAINCRVLCGAREIRQDFRTIYGSSLSKIRRKCSSGCNSSPKRGAQATPGRAVSPGEEEEGTVVAATFR